jgi:rod shape-determining protein MreD
VLNNLYIRYTLYFLVAVVLQATLVNYLRIFSWTPDLVLILLVVFALRFGPNQGMTAGFLVGVLQDSISTHFLGLGALSKTIAGALAGMLKGRFSPRTEFFLTLLIAGVVHDFVYFLLYTLGENFSFQSLIFLYTIPNVMYTVLIGGFLYYLIETWEYD